MGRTREALDVLQRINRSCEENDFVDTYLELEDLKSSTRIPDGDTRRCMKCKDLCQLKYLTRYSDILVCSFTFTPPPPPPNLLLPPVLFNFTYNFVHGIYIAIQTRLHISTSLNNIPYIEALHHLFFWGIITSSR